MKSVYFILFFHILLMYCYFCDNMNEKKEEKTNMRNNSLSRVTIEILPSDEDNDVYDINDSLLDELIGINNI
ncbi:hypothetical protein PGSY75_0421900 [Plasmodium gaboni]|uniref:Uncharacterized protein n=1 Tax=Plasmodium gaboni TaxID=647221 RepID=A0A151LUP9_9APIC|nr:hypothetical protein PGSY75_0421900 [Plasmodium gaboni]XP_028536836.1 conserved Plasmodium protein, unknown function [Plasmodium sp. gorilla clade G2]SOV21181.1 conserved Plasmodium protein, unknown function [Plasmodium sp. DRC-Itaito]KYO02904.1 hypothetical protein PGSY75_0421900 [Plasmodium gaboni]SOV11409.1 conserved Plasmodium protein, unknown function [Plasmodium gaboni]SOV11508.1 conserved Plasmodium protein, unknown function [Plasmodium sp. gorilla clade G2]